jgi:hypothetical protein
MAWHFDLNPLVAKSQSLAPLAISGKPQETQLLPRLYCSFPVSHLGFFSLKMQKKLNYLSDSACIGHCKKMPNADEMRLLD